MAFSTRVVAPRHSRTPSAIGKRQRVLCRHLPSSPDRNRLVFARVLARFPSPIPSRSSLQPRQRVCPWPSIFHGGWRAHMSEACLLRRSILAWSRPPVASIQQAGQASWHGSATAPPGCQASTTKEYVGSVGFSFVNGSAAWFAFYNRSEN